MSSPHAIKELRQLLAEGLNRISRTASAELDERRKRLERTEARIAGLVQFIAGGDHSDYIRTTLKDLEAQAGAEKAAMKSLKAQAGRPIKLPGIEELVDTALHIERIADFDPTKAGEELATWFEDGRIAVHPQPGDFYVAQAKFCP